MRICLDENVPKHVKYRLEAESHNVEFSKNICGEGTPDIELLRACSQERRVLLTNDSDFDKIHRTRAYHHEGILRYSMNQQTKSGWGDIVEGIGYIDQHISMRDELQWPKQWAKKFSKE